jgi:hypothetical protein
MDEEFSDLDPDFTVTATSPFTADVNDIVLKQTDTTRLILRSELVRNKRYAEDSVKACLMHQRRHSASHQWRDVDSFNLGSLRSGQEVRLQLNAETTRKLYDVLTMLYQLPVGRWSTGDADHFAVVNKKTTRIATGREKEIVETLIEEEGDRVWDYIDEMRPGLLDAALLKRQHKARVAALTEFEHHLEFSDWSEGD